MNRNDLSKELTRLGIQQDTLKEIQHRLDIALVTSGIDTHQGDTAKLAQVVLKVLEGMQQETQKGIDETSYNLKGRGQAHLN